MGSNPVGITNTSGRYKICRFLFLNNVFTIGTASFPLTLIIPIPELLSAVATAAMVILGLPGETKEDMLQSVRYVSDCGSQGIKLQLLHVLKGTDLASDYEKGLFRTLSFDEYIDLLADCVRLLPKDMIVHRLTGDGPKNLLIAPMWSADKKRVMNAIHQRLKKEGLYCE